jgi:cell division protease FtsH
VTKRPRITAFNDFGERTPSDRPPIKTRREIATERGEPWPPEDERQEPARVGGGSNGHGAGQNGSGQNGAGQYGAGQYGTGQNGAGQNPGPNGAANGWGAPNTAPVGPPSAGGPGADQGRSGGGDPPGRGAGRGIPDVYRTGGSSQPPSSVPPNYGAPPGWTPATTPRGTSWEGDTRPYGQHGTGSAPGGWNPSGGQHAAPEDGTSSSGRRSAPDPDPSNGGSFSSPGEGAPNPYGDPDGRRPDGRSES